MLEQSFNETIYWLKRNTEMPYIVYSDKEVKEKWDEIWEHQTVEDELHSINFLCSVTDFIEKHLSKDQRNLEAGCGTGKYLIYFSKKGYDVYGIDYSKIGVLTTKKYDANTKIMVGDVRSLPYKSESFGACLSLGVIEHIFEGPLEGLKETNRILKNGGTLVITGPCYEINYYAKAIRFWRKYKNIIKRPLHSGQFDKEKEDVSTKYFHEYHFTISELNELLSKAGFRIIEKGFFGANIELWHKFPIMRHNSTLQYKDFLAVKRSLDIKRILNRYGEFVEELCQRFLPYSFALGWMVAARKVKELN